MFEVKKLTKDLPSSSFNTITSNRGYLFSCFKEVKKLRIDFYFADMYCVVQKRALVYVL